ncbi:TRAP transporter substrate-binding protein [Pseudooceanicola sp. C21-150M6]|uniref:TRAP transporter substrate-binding protein n=1 Tax=Pseudooceanicola sp. C21-150M6 TaxID=3434355 RepID=UPI003D7FDF5A
MTVFTTALRGVAAAALLAGSGGLALAQEVTLKMHQFLPAQANVPAHVLDVWADKVEADSGGRIKIDRFPSMQLGGKPPELADQVMDGIADIVWTLPGYTPGRFPSTEIFELPFISPSAEATSRAYWQFAEKHLMETEFADLHMLGLWVHGPGVIHSSEPVTVPEDLNGVKLRAPTRVTNMLFTQLGATSVGLPVPAVPEALSKGVISATVIPWEVTPALKIAELVHNHTTFGGDALYTATFIFAMNKDKYDALPDDLKTVIDENSGLEFSAFAGRQMQEDDAPGLKAAQDAGNNIIALTPDQVAVWREASDGIEAAWIEEMTAKGMDAAAMVEEAKALIAENSSM